MGLLLHGFAQQLSILSKAPAKGHPPSSGDVGEFAWRSRFYLIYIRDRTIVGLLPFNALFQFPA